MNIASTVQPPTLYKYVPAEMALKCLPEVGDGSLRATQPAALNDPFECAIGSLFQEHDEAAGNQKFATVLTSLHGTSPVTADDVANCRGRDPRLYLRDLLSKQLSQRFGIVSFCGDPLHPLMWSHYTKDASGFVIGYDSTNLRDLVLEGTLLKVQYRKCMPRIADYPVLDEQNVQTLLTFKSAHWCYENEWRLIVELKATIGTGKTDQHSMPVNLLPISNSAVSSVYYTERTPCEKVAEIRRRVADQNNRYSVALPELLVMTEDSYGYEFDTAPGD